MFNIIQNNKMVEVLSGPERRWRRTPQEKIAITQQIMEPGMTVSHVARLHGINANQIFKWHRQYEDCSLTSLAQVSKSCLHLNLLPPISKSENCSAFWAERRWKLKYLKRLWSSAGKKMDSACALVARRRRITDVFRSNGVSLAQLNIRVNRPSGWQDRRRHSRFDDAAVCCPG